MHLPANSVLWGITLSLYAGGSGIPVPENALLIAGGYSLYQEICPPAAGILLWYAALICGDITLFLLIRWLFSRPAFSAVIDRFVRPEKLEKIQEGLFASRWVDALSGPLYLWNKGSGLCCGRSGQLSPPEIPGSRQRIGGDTGPFIHRHRLLWERPDRMGQGRGPRNSDTADGLCPVVGSCLCSRVDTDKEIR